MPAEAETTETTLIILGMDTKVLRDKVEKALSAVKGVEDATGDIKSKAVVVKGEVERELLLEALEPLGLKVEEPPPPPSEYKTWVARIGSNVVLRQMPRAFNVVFVPLALCFVYWQAMMLLSELKYVKKLPSYLKEVRAGHPPPIRSPSCPPSPRRRPWSSHDPRGRTDRREPRRAARSRRTART